MVNFNQMLGGPRATVDDLEMEICFTQYPRDCYVGDFKGAVVNRDGSVMIEFNDLGVRSVIRIGDIKELENVVRQLRVSAETKWGDDPKWKRMR